jgi:hypothetical protein
VDAAATTATRTSRYLIDDFIAARFGAILERKARLLPHVLRLPRDR